MQLIKFALPVHYRTTTLPWKSLAWSNRYLRNPGLECPNKYSVSFTVPLSRYNRAHLKRLHRNCPHLFTQTGNKRMLRQERRCQLEDSQLLPEPCSL